MINFSRSHKRYNPLEDSWILVSPHRMDRPWEGDKESPVIENLVNYDEHCYLCPGNNRAGGNLNPEYKDTFAFNNDFSALSDINEKEYYEQTSLLKAESENGICRVLCYSPDHSKRLALMNNIEILKVIDLWINEFRTLKDMKKINYVQIFENRGKIMGCSNMHPHGQIWAQVSIPDIPLKETRNQKKYFEENKECLLCSYLELEKEKKERIIYSNNSFTLLVPFWAFWPFELMVLANRHLGNILELSDNEKNDLAEILRITTVKYDNIFKTSFPYSMGIHQNPVDGSDYKEWHFHIHFFPPLLRSALIKKFVVGYELMAMPQRDISPEKAAEIIRMQPDVHY